VGTIENKLSWSCSTERWLAAKEMLRKRCEKCFAEKPSEAEKRLHVVYFDFGLDLRFEFSL